MSLPEPYGSPPGRPGKYALYISRRGDDDTQVMCVVFAAAYAVRKFLDVLLEKDGIVWEDDCTIRSETGIVVSTRWFPGRLKRAVEHEYSLQEMAWTLENPQRGWARNFRYGPPQPRTIEEDVGGARVREKRERRAASGPRVDAPAGSVHAKDIALSLGVEPREVRGALRKIMQKPSYGWWFKPDEVEGVKAKIKEALDG